MNSKLVKKRLPIIFFFLGLVLLFLLVREVGTDQIVDGFLKLKWKIVLVLMFPLSWYVIQSFAWWRVLKDDGADVTLLHILLAKLTGEAINTATPVSFVGGDPYRIYVLQKKVSQSQSAASVIIDRTMYILAVFLLLLTALVAAYFVLPLPGEWKWIFPLITAGFFVFFVGLVLLQRRGLLGSLFRLVQKIGVKSERVRAAESKLHDIDEQVGAFYRKNKLHFFEIMVLQYLGRFLGAVEIYLIVSLVGFPVTFVQCLFMASLTILINLSFFFIPGSLGVMESGYGALFYLLKLDPAIGVTIQLIRRIRAYFWIGVGLLIILLYRPKVVEQT